MPASAKKLASGIYKINKNNTVKQYYIYYNGNVFFSLFIKYSFVFDYSLFFFQTLLFLKKDEKQEKLRKIPFLKQFYNFIFLFPVF